MSKSKTINNIKDLEKEINIKVKDGDKKYLIEFFKIRFLRTDKGKIVYPEKKDLVNKNKELYSKLSNIKKELRFWLKEKTDAENYYKVAALKKYFRKIYWAHKVKLATDAEYKKDVENARLTEETITDPKYEHLLETFLQDSDYRKKLGDTVNSSLIYKNLNVGDSNKKKQIFKKETAEKKILHLRKSIRHIRHMIEINKTVLKYK